MSPHSSFEFDHEKIDAGEQAFDDAWAVIRANEPNRNLKYDCQRKAALSQKIGELVADGIIDPSELRRLALDSWPLWQAPRGTY